MDVLIIAAKNRITTEKEELCFSRDGEELKLLFDIIQHSPANGRMVDAGVVKSGQFKPLTRKDIEPFLIQAKETAHAE